MGRRPTITLHPLTPADIDYGLAMLSAEYGADTVTAYANRADTVTVTLTTSVPPMLAHDVTEPLRAALATCEAQANPADPACPWTRLYHQTAAALLALTGSDPRPTR